MKILITGGAGFIGSHLADKLVAEGDDVTVIDDLSTGSFANIEHLKQKKNFHFAIETILNEEVIDRLVSECDLIYHLAAAVGVSLVVDDPIRAMETNVQGTLTILKAANRYKKKVVITSTSETYGKGVNDSFTEDDDRLMGPIINNRWNYACSKSLDEFLGLAYYKQKNLPVSICRLFNTIGSRQTGFYGMVVPRFIQQALGEKDITVHGTGDQTRCFCDITDVLEGLVLIGKETKADGEVFNIGSTEEISINDLAEKIVCLTGSKSDIIHIPYSEAYNEGFEDMMRRKPNIKKMNDFFNWKPKSSLDSTLRNIISLAANFYKGKI